MWWAYSRRIGQRLVEILRNAPFGFWEKTRNIRISLLVSDTPAITNRTFEEHQLNGFPDLATYLKLFSPEKGKLAENEFISDQVKIYFAASDYGFHNISNFGNFVSKKLSTKYPLRIFNSNYMHERIDAKLESEPIAQIDNMSRFAKSEIYMIGNNPHSFEILFEFIKSKNENKILILHDLWLFDLFSYFGEKLNLPRLPHQLILANEGFAGLVVLSQILSGHELDQQSRFDLMLVFLNSLINHSKYTIFHSSDTEIANKLKIKYGKKVVQLTLPYGYVELSSQNNVTRNSKTFIISGTNSYTKNNKKMYELVSLILENFNDAQIIFAGSVAIEANTKLRNSTPSNQLKRIIFEPNCDDSKWLSLHLKSTVGIRLGVGKNGESSGLIRDYMMFHLHIITDDDGAELSKFPLIHHLPDSENEILALLRGIFVTTTVGMYEELNEVSQFKYLDVLSNLVEGNQYE